MGVELVHPITENQAREARDLLRGYSALLAADLDRLPRVGREDDRALFRDELGRCDRAIAALEPKR